MDRFHLMTVFVAVAEEQGFAPAARRLRISAPAVTRAVSALEQHLGVKLLTRTTRHVKITEAGARYLEDARRILADVYAADDAATGINAEPQGHLAVTAPVLFGRMFVMPGVSEYLRRYPKTQVDCIFLDRVVSLLDEGLDVGIRIGALPDSSMRAIRVGQVRMVLCASPEYLAEAGIPQSPHDLKTHQLIASRAGSLSSDWQFEGPQPMQLPIKPRLTTTTNDAAIAAAVAGVGIARVISYQVAEQLQNNQLKILLEQYEPAPKPVHIVHRQGRLASTKVRAFIDLMAERLRADKSLN